jgi:Uma2 family endonuclease
MAEARVRMTAEDLLRLPDTGKRYELVGGTVLETPPAGGERGYVAGSVLYRLRAFLEEQRLGGALFAAETGFRILRDPDTVRAADVAYVAQARLAEARVPGYPELGPDLVVEVVSPSDTASDIQDKVDDWLRAGVQLVWVLYPASQSAMVYRADGAACLLHADDDLDGEPVLPGFACRLADLF